MVWGGDEMGRKVIYLPSEKTKMAGTWILSRCVAHLRIFPPTMSGSLNYPLGEDQTIQRYLARLVDFPSKLRILWVVNLMTPVWFLVYRRGPQYLKIQGVIPRIFRAVLIPMVRGWLVSNCTVGVRCIQTLTFLNG